MLAVVAVESTTAAAPAPATSTVGAAASWRATFTASRQISSAYLCGKKNGGVGVSSLDAAGGRTYPKVSRARCHKGALLT